VRVASDDLLPWLRLCRAALPPRRVVALLEHFGSPEALLTAPARELCAAGEIAPPMAERLLATSEAECEPELAAIERLGVTLLTILDPGYPALLKEIADPPPVLFCRGALQPRDGAAVAVVGTRRASQYGRMMAERFGRELAEAGLTVVSGMARGVDTAAHRGALAARGRTVAVLGAGLDVPYPAENVRLMERVAEEGVLLSEAPMGAQPDAWRFPARNRIISGLSLGVLVVEGGVESGALTTARFAGEQGRDVFALPNMVGNPMGRGPHALIKDGAKLVEEVSDILEELRIPTTESVGGEQLALPELALAAEEARVLELLSVLPRPIDDLIGESSLTAAQVSAALMMLEVKGLVRKLPGNSYVRRMGRGE
jgi:DNA processing protein